MFLTRFNREERVYEVAISDYNNICIRTEPEELINNNIIVQPPRHFLSGFVVDALARYENTGLTPEEIHELQGDTLKKLKESNKILRENNDKYYSEYQKLLDENNNLKSLLKYYLDKDAEAVANMKRYKKR